VTYLWYIDR